MTANLRPWAEAYVGLPHKDDGIDRNGIDCRGLAKLVYRERLGFEPSFGGVSSTDVPGIVAAIEQAKVCGDWSRVVGPLRDYDIVEMWSRVMCPDGQMRRLNVHIGLGVVPDRVLHVEPGTDTVCVPRNHRSLRHGDRVVAVWRHKDLQ